MENMVLGVLSKLYQKINLICELSYFSVFDFVKSLFFLHNMQILYVKITLAKNILLNSWFFKIFD